MVKTLGAATALVVFLAASPLHGQRPTEQQVQTALQTRPDLVSALRSRINSSGMSADQIRARLKAAGYSESLLDAYLPGSTATAPAQPAEDVMRAVRFLGLVDAEQESQAKAPASAASTVVNEPVVPRSRIFGLDVFRRSTSQFEPDLAGPVDASYKLGPRDVLAVILTGGVENSYSLEITREGFIVIPQVGQVYVANLTLEQVTDVLYSRLRTVYSGLGRSPSASTQLYVTVARLRANQVFVLGDVQAPGSYQISSAGTMLTALYAAGGPSDNGNLRNVQLRRGNKVVGSLDIYEYLTNGNAANDVRLETGDVVFVPVHGPRTEITGAVLRPAIYELKPGATLADLISLAGGFTAEAERKRIVIHRIVPPKLRTEAGHDRTVIDVSAERLGEPGGPVMTLVEGDRVDVFSIAPRVRNKITVNGSVWTPGSQGFTPGMKLSDALRLAGGVKPDVKRAQISRLLSDESREELHAEFRDSLGTLVDDFALREDDIVSVFGTSDFRPGRYVAITGAVRNGGQFEFRDGMTLRDLLFYAGGLDDGAFLGHAEIARLPVSREKGTLATTIAAPLDSTYLLERGLDGRYIGPPGVPAPSGGMQEIPLKPYDNVLILRQPDWVLDRSVVILGEVRFPGKYALRSKTDRVTDLIQRAGGLTPVAYPIGAVFRRPSGDVGRIGFDLSRAIRDTSYRDNIVMVNGDTLYIPPQRAVVDVRGAVHSPIAVAYSPGKSLDYYIDAAGGATYNADKKRAYVQQPNGVVEPVRHRVLLVPDSRPEPLAGAVVVVPAKDPNEKKDWTAIIGSVAQVLASTVAIVAIATRF